MKKAGRIIWIVFSAALCILTAASSAYLIYAAYVMDLAPNSLWLYAFAAIAALLSIILFVLLIRRNKKTFGIVCTSLLAVVLILVQVLPALGVFQASRIISSISSPAKSSLDIISAVVLQASDIENAAQLNGKGVGTVENNDSQNVNMMVDQLRASAPDLQSQSFANYQEALKALYSHKIDALIMPESFRDAARELRGYANLDRETRVLEQMETSSSEIIIETSNLDLQKDPYTIYVMMTDAAYGRDAKARASSNLLVTVNPTTKTVLLSEIPRDTYMPTVCAGAAGCSDGAMDKLANIGIYSYASAAASLSSLLHTGVDIDIKVNLHSLIALIDALGGIDVEISKEQANDAIGLTEGKHHFNGTEALQFIKEHYLYQQQSYEKGQNLETVLEGIFAKASSPSSLMALSTLLSEANTSARSNITPAQAGQILAQIISSSEGYEVYEDRLAGVLKTETSASFASPSAVLALDQASLDQIKSDIQAVKDGGKPANAALIQ